MKRLVPREIETIYEPIPHHNRNYHWSASREFWDIGDPIGYGRTEEEAIKDLIEKEEELNNQ